MTWTEWLKNKQLHYSSIAAAIIRQLTKLGNLYKVTYCYRYNCYLLLTSTVFTPLDERYYFVDDNVWKQNNSKTHISCISITYGVYDCQMHNLNLINVHSLHNIDHNYMINDMFSIISVRIYNKHLYA